MKRISTTAFLLLVGCILSSAFPNFDLEDKDLSEVCKKLTQIQSKLTHSNSTALTAEQFEELSLHVQSELKRLDCPLSRHKRQACSDASVGDGWCDVECNTKEKNWDGGDCCPHTCQSKAFQCGSGGYQCLGARKIPVWFSVRTQLCYKWYADGDGGQCGGGASNHLCAQVNQMTAPYRDDTDGRPGGCRMSWGLETTALQIPDWFRKVAICYRWFADGNGGQCGAGAPAETCAALGTYTAVYRDDTDGRPGGCRMSWKISIPPEADYWAQDIKICYKWEPDGDGGQCGAGESRNLCAVAGSWTEYYRDDTDGRPGGCRMQWGLMLS